MIISGDPFQFHSLVGPLFLLKKKHFYWARLPPLVLKSRWIDRNIQFLFISCEKKRLWLSEIRFSLRSDAVSPCLPLEFPQIPRNHHPILKYLIGKIFNCWCVFTHQLHVKGNSNKMKGDLTTWVCHLSDNGRYPPNGRPNFHRANDHQPLDYNIQIYSISHEITMKSPWNPHVFPQKNPRRPGAKSPGVSRDTTRRCRRMAACRGGGSMSLDRRLVVAASGVFSFPRGDGIHGIHGTRCFLPSGYVKIAIENGHW